MALRTLYQTLLDSNLARLRVIARIWNISLTATQRADVAAELVDGMADADRVQRCWAQLPSDQQAALEALLREGGAMPWATFTRHWGQLRTVGPGRLEREELWRTPISPAEGLWYTGLLQRALDELPTGAVEMAFVPEELRLYLPTPAEQPIPPLPATAPPPVSHAAADALADELVTLLVYLHVVGVRPTPEGGWPERQRAHLLRYLRDPSPARLALLVALVEHLDWLQADEAGVLRPVGSEVLAWLQAPRAEQWRILVTAWLALPNWNTLAYIPTLAPDPASGWPAQPQVGRQNLVTHLLQHCTPGVWYPLHEWVTHVRAHAADFLRPDGDYDSWVLHDAVTDAPLRGFAAWEAVEGALAHFCVTGPLAWLGVVALGGIAPQAPPTAFRLTEAGADLLRGVAPADLPPAEPVQLQPNGTLLVPSGQRYAQFQLGRISQQLRGYDPLRYRLTPASLAAARQQRISLERILDYLTEVTAQPVPATLREAITRAYQPGERTHLREGWVLQVTQPALLELPAIRDAVIARLGPQAIFIREKDRARVLAALVQAGILPEIEE